MHPRMAWKLRLAAMAIALIAGLVLALPRPGAQAPTRVHRVAVLENVPAAANQRNFSAFREELRDLGYVEGRNLLIDYRSSDGHSDRFRNLVDEVVRGGAEVIVTRGDHAGVAARYATQTVPIVLATSSDPIANNIVRSLAAPRGNVTGSHLIGVGYLGSHRLRLLKEMVPNAKRIGMLTGPWHLYGDALISNAEGAARMAGVRVVRLEAEGPRDVDRTFEAALLARIDALITVEDYFSLDHLARIVEFAALSRLPAMYGVREFVEAGGLMSYGPDRRDLFRRAARYVDRIFKGATPDELPMEAPAKFELVINLKTAKALGIAIPADLLRRADELLE